MELEDVFETAGKKPGLQVWRVENKKLNPVEELCGSFYDGDAYILLYTSRDFAYNLHTWAGKNASQDESGGAAVIMVRLDYHLDDKAVQYTEFQGEESNTFKGYFKNGIKYMKGGVASGFNHVVTNDVKVQRLLHVKGRHFVRATEVPMSWESFNSGDCFVIDLGQNIYHWSGCKCNVFEKLKTTLTANDIRDNERGGRPDVHRINEGDEPEDVIEVLGPMPDLPQESCDTEASKKSQTAASLYMISNAAGSMKTTLVAEKNPFSQCMLKEEECYILDNGQQVFVWKGPKANPDERKAANEAAKKFIKDHNHSPNTQAVTIPAGSEPALFKQFFHCWTHKDQTAGLGQTHALGKIAVVQKIPFDASCLHENTAMAAQHGMFDDGTGEVKIFRVENTVKVPVDESTYGQFYGGDCYLVQYTCNGAGSTKYIIYTWQGQESSQDEQGHAALLTIETDDGEFGGCAIQVRVTQGKEPAHLASLFKGKLMVVYLGGTSRCGGQTAAAEKRLFHIRENSTKFTRAVEVDAKTSSLNTNDVFVLQIDPDEIMIWKGMGATAEEMEAAMRLADMLGGSVTEVEERNEPDNFWEALGGKGEYQMSQSLRNELRTPRLFECSNKTGTLKVEEVPGELTQSDLMPDEVMILDTGDELYVWVGENANEEEKKGALKIAKDYLSTDPSGRCGISINRIVQGNEPVAFTGWFQAWDPNMWENEMQKLISMFSR